ncbi:pyridoxamine 5'-phosphate oxidase family protein [Streptomyces sp. NPDC088732]|uniref:pyridoxamine 5'-phosphate oxidase family protein n=1 Tax=Streptomyces sp. NPDC088732 TaxID=3365879 RepID=UPI0037FF33EF
MEFEGHAALALLGKARYGRLALTRRALPYIAVARHVVHDGAVLIRTRRAWGVDGTVVAYQADDVEAGWAVQFLGTARAFEPSEEQRALFGTEPRNDTTPSPGYVYVRLDPRVHHRNDLASAW